mmetsp:Transcript_99399/g.186726  ORF Transcript_99399/g.186726 Transcript_99399/m.186726 type:complete len:396 (+) Transcript_99399:101-1288(+)
MYKVALFTFGAAMVGQGRRVRVSPAKESMKPREVVKTAWTSQLSAEMQAAFVPSGPVVSASAVGHQGSRNPTANLHSMLAKAAKHRKPNRGVASHYRAGTPKMHTDEPRPGPAGLYDKAVKLGTAKTNLPLKRMFAMGIASGAHIALGAFLAVSVGGSVPGIKATDPGLQRVLLGMFGLPMGLLMTVTAGGELVTGNFALCTAAWLEGKAKLWSVCKNWLTVTSANLVGSLLLAAFAFIASTGVGASAVAIATAKCSASFSAVLVKGILCNWLVCMAVWMATSTPDIGAKAMAVFFPITGFVALGLEHSVANMFLIPFGMLSGAQVSIADMLFKNLIPVTLGNLIGGALFVAYVYKVAFGKDDSRSPPPAPASTAAANNGSSQQAPKPRVKQMAD